MDYKTIYDNSYKTNFEKEEKKIKDELILGSEVPIFFHYVAGDLLISYKTAYDENLICTNKSLKNLKDKFTKLFEKYPENPIFHILEKDLKHFYLEISADELPSNYSYHLFIVDLAVLNSQYEVYRLFKQQDSLYKMMYELKDFTHFEIKYYDMILEQAPIYRKLHKILYPQPKETPPLRNIQLKDNLDENQFETKNIELYETIKFNISKFSDDEKIFLLHVYKSAKSSIPWTEYGKLMIITAGLKDLSIFDEGSVNNRFYDKLNKGIDYYGKSTQREFIKQIIEKMEPFGMSNINKAISIIKISIK